MFLTHTSEDEQSFPLFSFTILLQVLFSGHCDMILKNMFTI